MTAKLTAELLRSFISQQRLPHSNQAGALIDAVKAVGEKLIAAKPVGMLTLLVRLIKSPVSCSSASLEYCFFPSIVNLIEKE